MISLIFIKAFAHFLPLFSFLISLSFGQFEISLFLVPLPFFEDPSLFTLNRSYFLYPEAYSYPPHLRFSVSIVYIFLHISLLLLLLVLPHSGLAASCGERIGQLPGNSFYILQKINKQTKNYIGFWLKAWIQGRNVKSTPSKEIVNWKERQITENGTQVWLIRVKVRVEVQWGKLFKVWNNYNSWCDVLIWHK